MARPEQSEDEDQTAGAIHVTDDSDTGFLLHVVERSGLSNTDGSCLATCRSADGLEGQLHTVFRSKMFKVLQADALLTSLVDLQ